MAVTFVLLCLQPPDAINQLSSDQAIGALNSFVFPPTEKILSRAFRATKISEREIKIAYTVQELLTIETIMGPQSIQIQSSYLSKLWLSQGLLMCYTGSKIRATEMADGIKSSLGDVRKVFRVIYPDIFLRKLRDNHSLYTTFIRMKASDPLNQIILKGHNVTESPIYTHFYLNRNEILELEVKPRGVTFQDAFLRVKHTGIVRIEGVSISSHIYEELEKQILRLIQTIKGEICPKTTLTQFMTEMK